MITITRIYIFRWRSRCRRRPPTLIGRRYYWSVIFLTVSNQKEAINRTVWGCHAWKVLLLRQRLFSIGPCTYLSIYRHRRIQYIYYKITNGYTNRLFGFPVLGTWSRPTLHQWRSNQYSCDDFDGTVTRQQIRQRCFRFPGKLFYIL